VKLYGKVFDLVSDPVIVGENFVFVDALEQRSGKVMRVRIPPTIVQMARIKTSRSLSKQPNPIIVEKSRQHSSCHHGVNEQLCDFVI
jgi:hypothetical protein